MALILNAYFHMWDNFSSFSHPHQGVRSLVNLSFVHKYPQISWLPVISACMKMISVSDVQMGMGEGTVLFTMGSKIHAWTTVIRMGDAHL